MYKTFFNTNMIYGEGSISHLESIPEKKIAILMAGEFQRPIIDKITTSLHRLDKECKVIGTITREPHMEDINEPLKEVLKFQPDCIVALGGGAVIDSAKAIWIFYEYPEMKWDNIILPNPVPKLGNKAILIAIPTTSGTGSETSCCAVVVDTEKLEKKLVINQNILPTLAILDSQLTYTMPRSITANSGMDAFAHAIEAATSKANNKMVQRISLITLIDIFDYLPISVNGKVGSEEFKKSREMMQVSSYLAGVAINNAGTGLAHIFDQVGPKLNLPHGLVCAIILPNVIEFNGDIPFYVELAKYLGYKEENGSANFIADKIRELNKSIGIPLTFRDLEIGEEEYLKAMEETLEAGMMSGGLHFVAKVPTYEEAKQFMLDSYYRES